MIQRSTEFDASIMSPFISPLHMHVNSLEQGMGSSFNFLLEASVPRKVQEVHISCSWRGQASRSLLVLDDFSGPFAVNKFESLLLSLIVFALVCAGCCRDVCAKFPSRACKFRWKDLGYPDGYGDIALFWNSFRLEFSVPLGRLVNGN